MSRSIFLRFQQLGLQRRIMLYVTAGLVAFSAIYGFVALQAIRQSTDLVFRERLLVARTVAREMDSSLAHAQGELEDMSATIAASLSAGRLDDAQNSLRTLYDHWILFHRFGNPCVISLTDARGRVLWSEPYLNTLLGRNLAQLPYLQNAFQFQRATITNGIAPDASARPTVALAVPIRAETRLVGFLVAEIDRAHIGGRLEPSLEVGEAGYAVEVIDRSGLVIMGNVRGKQLSQSNHLDLVEPLWSAGQSGVQAHTSRSSGAERSHVIAFAPLTRIPWGVIVEQEVDEALILPRTLQMQFILFGLLALIGGLALAWVTTRTVVRPVNALIHASQGIARGDLDHPLDVSGADEVGALARTFDEMRAALKQSREEIARWNRELEARVQQRTRELAALVESSNVLISTRDLDELFEILIKTTRGVFPSAEGIALFLFEHASQLLVARASCGFAADESARLCFRVGEAMEGQVFEAQTPLLLKTAAQALGDRAVQSALGVPLISKGTRLGALMLYNFSRAAVFTENDVPILQALANQAAAALENARLYAELQHKEAARTQLLERLIVAQEEERKRMARDLHDQLGSTLGGLTLSIEAAEQSLQEDSSQLKERLERTKDLATQALEDTHKLILDLRPVVLDDLGLVAAIRADAETHLRSRGIDVQIVVGGARRRLKPELELALFRIVQEAITNIAKHAEARHVNLALEFKDSTVVVRVEDDGKGFDVQSVRNSEDRTRGLGLLGMAERATLVGGSFQIESRIGRGTQVAITIPAPVEKA
jgi:signal transduction histidine kinase/HAMP domain-containing protein